VGRQVVRALAVGGLLDRRRRISDRSTMIQHNFLVGHWQNGIAVNIYVQKNSSKTSWVKFHASVLQICSLQIVKI
jgi:hypothetical protein